MWRPIVVLALSTLAYSTDQELPAGTELMRVDSAMEKDGVVRILGHTFRTVDGKEQPMERLGFSCVLKLKGCGLPSTRTPYLMMEEDHTTYQQPEYVLIASVEAGSARYVVALGKCLRWRPKAAPVATAVTGRNHDLSSTTNEDRSFLIKWDAPPAARDSLRHLPSGTSAFN